MGYCILTEDTQPHNVSSNCPFLGHLQDTFSIQDGQFKEGTHYFVLEKIGSGAFGECYKGYTSNDPSFFCIKKDKAVKCCLNLSFKREKRLSPLPGERGCRVGLMFNLKTQHQWIITFRWQKAIPSDKPLVSGSNVIK